MMKDIRLLRRFVEAPQGVKTKRLTTQLVLSSNFIAEVLSIYRAEHLYIHRAVFAGDSLTADLLKSQYPYTNEEVFDYVTAVTGTFYLNQLTYTLIAAIIAYKTCEAVADLTLGEFYEARDRGEILYANLELGFRHKVPNKDLLNASISLGNIRRRGQTLFSQLNFNIEQGITGRALGVCRFTSPNR